MDLYKQLGHEKQQTKTSGHAPTSLEGTIKKGINEVVHAFLLKTYPQYYKQLDTTTIVKNDSDNKSCKISDISGYRLLIPMDEQVEVQNNGNKLVLEHAVRVASPQIYLQGVKNNVCEYVKIGGKTTLWNKKQNDFLESKTK